MKRYAGYFKSITRYCDDPDLEAALARFRQLDADTAIPLLLSMFDRYESEDESSKISKTVFLNMMRAIESFIIRRSILRARTRGYGLDFSQAISNSGSLQFLVDFFVDKGWPTDEEVKTALIDFEFYLREPKKCRLVLTEIERAYGHKERLQFDSLTIEHVMPQDLTQSWREMLGSSAEDVHDKYLHTLGNLTLTGYNGEMGNKPFAEKLLVFKNSNLELNTFVSSQEKWTDKEIVERTRTLAERFVDLWYRLAPISTGPTKKKKSQ